MKKGHLIVAFVGTAIFAWVITHIGLPAILQQLAGVRSAIPIVLLMSLCRLLLQTTAWSQALRDQSVSVPLGTLMGVRIASQSMGYLTVLGPGLSEPLKIRLLRAPAEPTMTATFLDDGVYWFTATLMGIAGWLCLPLVAVHVGHLPADRDPGFHAPPETGAVRACAKTRKSRTAMGCSCRQS